MEKPDIIALDDQVHGGQVIALFERVFGDDAAHMAPDPVIGEETEFGKGLSFVALKEESVIGAIVTGYDGFEGSIYAIAVLPDYQRKGIGASLLTSAEEKLSTFGCKKFNLQMMEEHEAASRFFSAMGYQVEKRISMAKRASHDTFDPDALRFRAAGFAKALDADDFDVAKTYLAPNCRYLIKEKDLQGQDAIIQNYREGSEQAKTLFDHVGYGSEILKVDADGVVVQFTDLIEVKGQTHVYSSRQRLEFRDDGLIIHITHEEIPGELEAIEAILKRLGVTLG